MNVCGNKCPSTCLINYFSNEREEKEEIQQERELMFRQKKKETSHD